MDIYLYIYWSGQADVVSKYNMEKADDLYDWLTAQNSDLSKLTRDDWEE